MTAAALPQPGGLHRYKAKSNAMPNGLHRAGLLEPSPDSSVLGPSLG